MMDIYCHRCEAELVVYTDGLGKCFVEPCERCLEQVADDARYYESYSNAMSYMFKELE
jgi:hypothetical protein